MKNKGTREFFGLGILEQKCIINYLTYKGKGRPREMDYITLEENQTILNRFMNLRLNSLINIVKR